MICRIRFPLAIRAAVALSVAIAAGAAAEVVPVSVPVATTPGRSVFLSAEHPDFGGGELVTAVKLHALDYTNENPNWKILLDLAPGITLQPIVYTRQDAPNMQADPANGVPAPGVDLVLTTKPAPQTSQVVRVIPGDDVNNVRATIFSEVEPGFTPVTVEFSRTKLPNGTTVFEGTLPAEHANYGRMVRFSKDATMFPDEPVRIGYHPVWWRYDQAFLYDVTTMTAPPAPARTETFTFTPTNFRPRTIRVQLPRGFDQNPDRRYPVIYAMDGQNVFAPGGPFGSWDLDVTVRKLTAIGEIPEVILVGVDNTQDRFAEYTPEYGSVQGTQGRGGEFLAALRDGLLPAMEARYPGRIATGPENTSILGSSLGGLISWHACNDFESTWGAAVAMSPSFQVNLQENLTRADRGPDTRGRLYIDSGNSGPSSDGYWNTYDLRDRLLRSGHALGPRTYHRIGLGQQHNEAAWRDRAPGALKWLFHPRLAPEATAGVASTWLVTDGANPARADAAAH